MNKDTIFAARTKRIEAVNVPEWGSDPVYIRNMTGNERDAHEAEQYQRQKDGADLQNFRARLLVRCLCNEDGSLIFSPEDAPELGLEDAAIVMRLFEVATRINGMTTEAAEEAKKN